MIVREGAALPTALERLLQVERITSLAPLLAVADGANDAPGARASLPLPLPLPLAAAATRATGLDATATLIAALPLGRSITARVVDVPAADHVVAEIGDLRVALAWPAASGLAPQPGDDLALRVLAHRPTLLFESIEGTVVDASDDGDQVHWSSDAMRLQSIASPAAAPQTGTGAMRFDIPILEIEIEPLVSSPSQAGDEVDARSGAPARTAPAPAGALTPYDRPIDTHSIPAMVEHARNIALDAVIVAHGTALVDGVETPPIALPKEGLPPTPFVPLLLQGPAWDGQPMELVVRRDRDDAAFDNPVLDHWCGEVTIDLPHLGRVAGHLSFSMQGLRVRIEGDDEHSVMTMSAASAELAAALANADLRVAGLTVAGRSADTTRTDWGAGLDTGYGTARHG